MQREKTIITRRDFLKIGATAAVGGVIGLPRTASADTRFGLGNSRPEMIDLIKLGWDEGILI